MKRAYLFNQIFWKRIAGTGFPSMTTTIYRQYYNGVKEEISDIKPFLKKYKGGSVDLEKKDNGICHVILNHPERRNALSGKIITFGQFNLPTLNSRHFPFLINLSSLTHKIRTQSSLIKIFIGNFHLKTGPCQLSLLFPFRKHDGRSAGHRGRVGELGGWSRFDIARCF